MRPGSKTHDPPRRRRWRWLLWWLGVVAAAVLAVECFGGGDDGGRPFFGGGAAERFYDLPRPGERPIATEEFVQCALRLVGDAPAAGGRAGPRVPVLILPVLMDYADLKAFMCNVTVPVGTLVIVQNGAFAPSLRLLRALEARAPTHLRTRVVLRFHPGRAIGYAAAVNEGFRAALRLPYAEAPWVLVANMDVRFGPDTLRLFTGRVWELTRRDAPVYEALDRLARAEGDGSDDDPWAERGPRHRARLLPRGNHSAPQPFAAHHGIFLLTSSVHLCVFARSRLHLETVGLFDENFYPAYGEDHDLQWRSELLGFRYYHFGREHPAWLPETLFTHFSNGNLRAARLPTFAEEALTGFQYHLLRDAGAGDLAQLRRLRRMQLADRQRHRYRQQKWFRDSRTYLDISDVRAGMLHPIFGGRFTVGDWVRDDARIAHLAAIGDGRECRGQALPYNTDLLKLLGKLAALRRCRLLPLSAQSAACVGGRRWLHTPPGGFEHDLPPSFGRHRGKGSVSTVNLRVKSLRRKRVLRDRRRLLTPPPAVSLEAVKRELQQLGAEAAGGAAAAAAAAAPRARATEVDPRLAAAEFPLVPRPGEGPAAGDDEHHERLFSVTPATTVFGSELDRLERDHMREHHQAAAGAPPLDRAYEAAGNSRRARRLRWEPSSSYARVPRDRPRDPPPASYFYAEAEALREAAALGPDAAAPRAPPQAQGRPSDTAAASPAAAVEREAEENPHFPVAADAAEEPQEGGGEEAEAAADSARADSSFERVVHVDARTDYRPRLVTLPPATAAAAADPNAGHLRYDAYRQRPAEAGEAVVRGADYWHAPAHRERVETHARLRAARVAAERLAEGAMDTGEVEYSTNLLRKETFLYLQAHPINEMIQEHYVRIREVYPLDGGAPISYNPERLPDTEAEEAEVAAAAGAEGDHAGPARAALEALRADADVPLAEARRLARELGLDLIRVGSLYAQTADRRITALCILADHREHMREMVRYKMQRLGVQPPRVRRQIEVPFRGGTHPHGIRFKAVGVAKHLLQRHVVRLNLTKFGTPREGFPVFQSILDEVKRQCLQLRAYHRAGVVQANYNEIFCYLYPSTGRSPKTSVEHPTPAEMADARDLYTLEMEKEVHFDDLRAQPTARERLRYLRQLQDGTAWAQKDGGLSLQRQRRLKVMLGYLPKGNDEMYAARGDVNVPAPFRTSHPTGTERWTHPRETNLEQASRGAAVLGKRAALPISEMHDAGETPENPSQLDRFYYRAQGPALEVGELKEAFGLKDNRRKVPPLAPGFATVGVDEPSGVYDMGATK